MPRVCVYAVHCTVSRNFVFNVEVAVRHLEARGRVWILVLGITEELGDQVCRMGLTN